MDQPLTKLSQYYEHDVTWVFANCGHWILIQRGQILDGCPKCRMGSMRDNRHQPKRNY